jgi:hypothetical protein
MQYLTDTKHRYAAALLVNDFHNNVESALNEAERWENGEFNSIVSDYDFYYLVYDEKWASPYIIKVIDKYRFHMKGAKPDVTLDENVKRFRW